MPGESLPLARQRPCRRPSAFVVVALVVIAALTAAPARAQESRGSITGRVVDSSGGVLPGVSLAVVNTATNGTTTVVTNETGVYTALYLIPGDVHRDRHAQRLQERQAGRHPGARRRSRRHRHHAGPGRRSRKASSSRPGPVLETGTATMGQVIDAKLISEIPLGDGTAYGLTRLIPGATFERSYALQRPMDNDNLRGMTVTGTISSEFSIDGSSNVVSQARAGIQPPAEAIQEFKVDTAAYDAQIGHTGAGSVNLALKSGTNRFNLAGSFYNRDDSRSEDLFASHPQQHRQDDPRLQPLRRDRIRPDLQEQDVLHGVVREAAGRHRGVVPDLGADREDAAGRLLGTAGGGRADLRSAARPATSAASSRASRLAGTSFPPTG